MSKTNWKQISEMKDKDINMDDIPEFSDKELAKATPVDFSNMTIKNAFLKSPKAFLEEKQNKVAVSIRLDKEILSFFKSHTNKTGYQTIINNVLRAYVKSHSH